jgi:hypothetical protein
MNGRFVEGRAKMLAAFRLDIRMLASDQRLFEFLHWDSRGSISAQRLPPQVDPAGHERAAT